MTKVVNLKDKFDAYLDSSSIVHNKELLSKLLNDNFNYSLDEKIVGTWVDGKQLYRKTINFGQLPNASVKIVNHNISNIDYITKIEGTASRQDSNTLNLDSSDKDGVLYSVHLTANKYQVAITTGSDRSSFTRCYITIEYTKTTN